MLTRHFYESDEVCYALIESLRFRKTETAVFWARELILSEMDEELSKTVVQGWIMCLGIEFINWLDAWFKTDDTRLALIVEFCKIDRPKKKMSSCALTFWIGGRGFAPLASESRITQAISENDPISLYWFLGSSYEKRPSAVFEIVKSFVDDPSIFDSLNVAFQNANMQIKVLLSICAIQLLCENSYPHVMLIDESTKDLVTMLLDSWPVGYKISRRYTIHGLPQGYKRSLQCSLCCSALDLMDKGCTFWQKVKKTIIDDISLETTVTQYFPDDIPDEWSIQERVKSHVLVQDVYKVDIHPEYIMKKVFNAHCTIRSEWFHSIKVLYKACRVVNSSL